VSRLAREICKEIAPSAGNVDAVAAIESYPTHTEQFRGFGSFAFRLVECLQKLGTFIAAGIGYKPRDRTFG
jgi:hypothetical protein